MTDIATAALEGRLKHGEEQLLRGALVRRLGSGSSTLLHNHTGEGLRFAYPLVQYKIIGGRPAVVGVGEGAPIVARLKGQMELTIGKEQRAFSVAGVSIRAYRPEVADEPKMYSLERYIPLNSDNVDEYESMAALTDRVCFLENIINANILAFFKGIGYHCADELQTAITSVDKREPLYYKGVRFWGFDLRFISNVLLPDDVGLGKSSSVGFGTLRRVPVPEKYLAGLGRD